MILEKFSRTFADRLTVHLIVLGDVHRLSLKDDGNGTRMYR